jgi:hypothetical protein
MTERSAFLDHKFLNCPGKTRSTRDTLRLVTLADFWKDTPPLAEVDREGAFRQTSDPRHRGGLSQVTQHRSGEVEAVYEHLETLSRADTTPDVTHGTMPDLVVRMDRGTVGMVSGTQPLELQNQQYLQPALGSIQTLLPSDWGTIKQEY